MQALPKTTMVQTPNRVPDSHQILEAQRLQCQHELVKDALGGLILCPIDLSGPHLRILDSGTGNGYWLHDLRTQLKYPETATMVGTDIAPVANASHLPVNIMLCKQNILEDWPQEWEGSFDLVHQRATMAYAGSHDRAVEVTRRLVRLLKPGGWLQLVDGYMPVASIHASDAPSTMVFKAIGLCLAGAGLDATIGSQLSNIIQDAGGLEELDCKKEAVRLGYGAAVHLVEAGLIQVRGLGNALTSAVNGMKDPPIASVELSNGILPLFLEEASLKGIDMVWYASWGRKVIEGAV